LPDVPPEATFKGYEDFVVQDLVLQPRVVRYRRERWLTPDGQGLVAPLPADVLPGSHYGPDLICFILHQYHHQHVTQPLLLEQLHQLGIDISAGELSHILTEGKDAFHQEKAELLPAALAASVYVQVDDTGARHQAHSGFCTHISNELFASFASTDSKSRLNFLEVLRQPHADYVINETTVAYWQRQKLPAAVVDQLRRGPRAFVNTAARQGRLRELGITKLRHVRIASEGALLGSLIAHGVSPQLVILSDGVGQYDLLAHAACWIHAERPLARLIPYSDEHRVAIAKVRQEIGELYRDLKGYRQRPERSRRADLEARFDALCRQRTGFPSIDGMLKAMGAHRAALLQVLDRSEIPLHTNLSEGHLRDYVKKRKISGSTRSELGRAGHVREPEEDVPGVGSELLGLSLGPSAGIGSNSPLGSPDPPEGGGDAGYEGRGRAAGVGEWRRGGVNAGAIDRRFFRATPVRRPVRNHGCPRLLRGYVEKVTRAIFLWRDSRGRLAHSQAHLSTDLIMLSSRSSQRGMAATKMEGSL